MEFSNWGSVPLKSELEIRNCILEESLEKLKNTAICGEREESFRQKNMLLRKTQVFKQIENLS